jgi:anti-sigma B factor antagonist
MIKVTEIDNSVDHVVFDGIEKFNALVSEDARIQLSKLFEVANARVILDLSGINYIDSSGFGCFLTTMKSARNNYGVLKLCNLDQGVKALFNTLQLHTIFEIYDDLESCVASFR